MRSTRRVVKPRPPLYVRVGWTALSFLVIIVCIVALAGLVYALFVSSFLGPA